MLTHIDITHIESQQAQFMIYLQEKYYPNFNNNDKVNVDEFFQQFIREYQKFLNFFDAVLSLSEILFYIVLLILYKIIMKKFSK